MWINIFYADEYGIVKPVPSHIIVIHDTHTYIYLQTFNREIFIKIETNSNDVIENKFIYYA